MNNKTVFLLLITIFILFINFCLSAGRILAAESTEVIARPNIEYKAQVFRDPFESYLKEEKEEILEVQKEIPLSPPRLEIQGIVWGGSIPQAIINNKVVKVGDTIEEAQIMKIDKEGIIILYKGRRFNLSSPAKVNLENLKKE